ncbi:hypothetical protein RBU61_08525 [Tissierella sp. MB52-C2]|uniref:hypothetical protein n=1 Tax=Tissierella sp. MB52-C2 TaxID=3070999 RepID=UPI00280AFD34|nr:hypothetical protein [Tissierella sp. MB52-C2]WMM26710.1 hypothetical protein RBU61_08525 [Tissierella sp. MB52-C2]
METNRRVAYTDSEIRKLMKNKMKDRNDNVSDLFQRYKNSFNLKDNTIINDIVSGNIMFDVDMLNIVSDYLEISFEELTRIIEDKDEVKFRKNEEDEELDCFVKILSGLFSEIIRHKKLNQ